MFGIIDKTLKPRRPQIFLAKPNRQIIGKLNNQFAYNVVHDINLGQLNEISFNMPYDVEKEIKHKLVRNPYIDKILERYLLKVKLGNSEEWYIINEIKDNVDDGKDIRTVHAFSLGYELNDRIIQRYEVVGYSLWQVSNEVLDGTLWSVGDVDPIFDLKFRSFDVTDQTVLDIIFEIGETFGALVEFDTVNRKIHFRDPEKVGQKRGYTIGYGKYLRSLSKTSTSDEMVTRLYIYGKDRLSINRVNPAGTPYLEDFSYFMFPFERDENRNVIRHSRYMSDELCHAILDYNELLESKKGVFADLLAQQEQVQIELTNKENELFQLETDLANIQQRLDVQRAHGTFLYRENEYNNKSDTIGFGLTPTSYYAIMVKINNSQLKIKVDNASVTVPSINQWHVIKKIANKDLTYIDINGTGKIQLYIVEIFEDEYNATDNSGIIEKYNEHKKTDEVNAKKAEVDEVKQRLADIESQIEEFRQEISIENNFTPELIEERNQYIISRVWSDENYFDDQELLEAGKKKFLEYKQPKTIIDLDIINFLDVLEESHNWDKLAIGDEIKIKYEKTQINVRAKITKISFDYDNQSIKLTIANVQDLFGEAARLLEMLKSSYSTSVSVDANKGIWNQAFEDSKSANEILNSTWEAAKRRILAGTNETVDIGNRGIIIRNPDFPNEMIILQSGIIGLSRDGGLNWQTAITPYGLIAERLMGKAIVGENLTIGDAEGTFEIKGNLLTVKDRASVVRLLLGEYADNKFGLKLFNKTGYDVILDEDGILQTWQEGRADNVDPNHGLSLYVYIPEETLSIRKAKLRFKLLPFRTYSKNTASGGQTTRTTSSGGGTTVTSSSGGGKQVTSSAGGAHTATSSAGGAHTATSSSGGGIAKSTYSGGGIAITSGSSEYAVEDDFILTDAPELMSDDGWHLHRINLIWLQHTHPITIPAHAHNFDIPNHSHTVSIPNHSHTVSIPNHTHTVTLDDHTHRVTIPNHTHEVEIPSHNHDIVHGIYTGTSASGVGIIINGINRTSQLGGKFYTDENNIDITQYLAVGHWNEIRLTSDTLGRIDANVFIQAFVGV